MLYAAEALGFMNPATQWLDELLRFHSPGTCEFDSSALLRFSVQIGPRPSVSIIWKSCCRSVWRAFAGRARKRSGGFGVKTAQMCSKPSTHGPKLRMPRPHCIGSTWDRERFRDRASSMSITLRRLWNSGSCAESKVFRENQKHATWTKQQGVPSPVKGGEAG